MWDIIITETVLIHIRVTFATSNRYVDYYLITETVLALLLPHYIIITIDW